MSSYDKSDFHETRRTQYSDFKHVMHWSIVGVVLVLFFLGLMLKWVWS